MPDKNHLLTPTSKRPFATTADRYNDEQASGNVKGSNFPHHEVRSLPGYSERDRPCLTAAGVTNELACCLAEYAKQQGSLLPYQQRDMSHYLWLQASRRMLAWEEILSVVRVARKRGRRQPIGHYFGYCRILGKNGTTRAKKRIKLVRYISQEGACVGCRTEFQFSDLTLDRIKPGKAKGEYVLPNVQLMCRPCNNHKGANYDRYATHP